MNFPEKKALMEYLSRIGTYVMGLMDEDVANTYRDFLSWDEQEQWEIIRGRACHENAFKSESTAEFRRILQQRFSSYFNGSSGLVRTYPEILTLSHDSNNESSIMNVVIPDLCLYLRQNDASNNGFEPRPAIIIEIADIDNAYHLFKKKHDLYQEYGIPQYWIADPERRVLYCHCRDHRGVYGTPEIYSNTDYLSLDLAPPVNIVMEALSQHCNDHPLVSMSLCAACVKR